MENFINLTDGTRIEAVVNFGTLYYLEECGAMKLEKKIREKEEAGKKLEEMDSMRMASKVIYAILRSNGKRVTMDEAMALIPPDTSEIENIMQIFERQLEAYKKKEDSKKNMMKTFR